ncbi:thiamine biosynthesis lipoprotein [Desulfacinum hydrothermale DSM 13146]|uniref:FAD:protein FMN transferase n=1 Tax=Desulfacinum hydrothermale DSM 13146 TaxID=1121390 RepID=A0A1W1XG32_9BACT|nr:FAD:protein FMN transferase [Desulfacinum hydrothermale]SMC22744.1 thiamine biosynthesis lipoprotein [Desulfacinum hydrothermale DSM 13146]
MKRRAAVTWKTKNMAAVFVFTVLALWGCSRQPQVTAVARPLMGTVVEISVVSRDEGRALHAIKAAFSEMERIERQMSFFRKDSELSRLNRRAGQQPVKVSSELWDLLRASVRISQMTQGGFDVTVAPLLRLWPIYRAEKILPTDAKIEEALRHVGYGKLLLGQQDHTVAFADPGMALDLGGIAKGHAIDRAVQILKGLGVQAALVNAGGDLYAYGRKPDGKPWRIGIRHPRQKEGILATARVEGVAVVTSGDYERFFIKNGKRYSHIIDPRSGFTARETAAVTVVAPQATLADGLATGVLVLGPEKGLSVVEGLPGVEAAVVREGPAGGLEFWVSTHFLTRLGVDAASIRRQGVRVVEWAGKRPRVAAPKSQ